MFKCLPSYPSDDRQNPEISTLRVFCAPYKACNFCQSLAVPLKPAQSAVNETAEARDPREFHSECPLNLAIAGIFLKRSAVFLHNSIGNVGSLSVADILVFH